MTTRNHFWIWLRLLVLLVIASVAARAFSAEIPIVHILATDPCASETGPDTATFIVIRTGPTNDALTVAYDVGGTAENGVDYLPLSGLVTIPAGAHSAPITVTPIDDDLIEGGESILIALEQPLLWPPPYIVCWPSLAFAHIEDNDLPPTNRPPNVAIVSPPDGSVFLAPVDVTILARAFDRDGHVRTVEFFADGNSLGIVTNPPPISVRPASIIVNSDDPTFDVAPDIFPDFEVQPAPDPVPILPGAFRLVWSNAPPGDHVLTAMATDNLGASSTSDPVGIKVTEPPPRPIVEVFATDPNATEPGPADARLDTATFTVHRSGSTDFPLVVYYRLGGTASNGIDYRLLPNSVTIPAGERSANVVIEPLDDNLVESTETVVLAIEPPVCIDLFPPPPDCYLPGRHRIARALIHDNDETNRPPVVAIVRPLDGSVFLAPADVAIVAAARDFDGDVATVEFLEGTNSLGIVTNNPAALDSSRPPFFLVWSNVPPGRYILTAEATDDGGASSRSRPVEIKVVERTLPPIVSIIATDPEASEGLVNGVTNTATFSVMRTGGTDRPLPVFYSLSGTASNGVDYRELPGRIVIPVGASAADIVVWPLDDQLVEGPETVVVNLEPPICVTVFPPPRDCYLVGTNSRARAVIRDNDVTLTNLPPKVALIRPLNGDTFVAPADILIAAQAGDADGFVGSVEFFAGTKSLGVVSNSGPVTIGATLIASLDGIFRLVWSNVPPGEYRLRAEATDNKGATSISEPVWIKVIEPSLPPIVTIYATDPFASEGDLVPSPVVDATGQVALIGPPIIDQPRTATFTVRRSAGTNNPLVVYYELNGSALNGIDYLLLPGKVTIPAGSWTADIVVDPIDDKLVENTESVVATLLPVACPKIFPPPPECYLVGDPDRAIAYIRDNDVNQSPKVEIVSPLNGTIFTAPADIEIDAVAIDPDGWVTQVAFFAGTNLIGVGEIAFLIPPPPGQIQHFSIKWPAVPAGRYLLTAQATDNLGAIRLSAPVGIAVVGTNGPPVVNIVATDPFASEGVGSWGTNTATFRIRRSDGTNSDLTVFYSIRGTASNGVDYVAIGNSVTIPAGRHSAHVTIIPIDDHVVEGIETVVLRLEEPPTLPAVQSYLIGRPARAAAIILDNDLPRPPCLRLPDGLVHLSMPGTNGFFYRLESSIDLIHWDSLFSNVISDGAFHFVDPDAPELGERFFRLLPEAGVFEED